MSEGRLLNPQTSCCGRVNRRVFLADCGMGFTGLVLGSMLQRDGILKADAHGSALAAAGWQAALRAEGEECHLAVHAGWRQSRGIVRSETCLNKYAGKSIDETPHKGVLDSPYTKKNVVEFVAGQHASQIEALPHAGRLSEARTERHRGQ